MSDLAAERPGRETSAAMVEAGAGRAPMLVLAVGNPSRGDDALGPAFMARIEVLLADLIAAGRIELLTDFQLQVEHALDLEGRDEVVFVDASVAAPAPFAWEPVVAARDASASSHALSPAAVLDTLRTIGREAPPRARILAIRGIAFELGAEMTAEAERHLDAAVAAFCEGVRRAP